LKYLRTFLTFLGISFIGGFQPTGSLGSTLDLKGSSPTRSGLRYWPNSLGRLQSMTPL